MYHGIHSTDGGTANVRYMCRVPPQHSSYAAMQQTSPLSDSTPTMPSLHVGSVVVVVGGVGGNLVAFPSDAHMSRESANNPAAFGGSASLVIESARKASGG